MASVIQHNNEGVRYLIHGDTISANQHFRAALEDVLVYVKSACPRTSSNQRSKSGDARRKVRKYTVPPLEGRSTVPSICRHVDEKSSDGVSSSGATFAIASTQDTNNIQLSGFDSTFQGAPYIAMSVVLLREGTSRPNPLFLYTVVVFNSALAKHFGSLQSGISDDVRKSTSMAAIRLYKVTMILLTRALTSSSDRGRSSKYNIMELSTLNNLGLMYFQAGHHRRAQDCFDRLSSSLRKRNNKGMIDVVFADEGEECIKSGVVDNLRVMNPACLLAPAA